MLFQVLNKGKKARLKTFLCILAYIFAVLGEQWKLNAENFEFRGIVTTVLYCLEYSLLSACRNYLATV